MNINRMETLARQQLIEHTPPAQAHIKFKANPDVCQDWHAATNSSPERVRGTLIQHFTSIYEVVSIFDGYDRALGWYKEITAREYLERPVDEVFRLEVRFEKEGSFEHKVL